MEGEQNQMLVTSIFLLMDMTKEKYLGIPFRPMLLKLCTLMLEKHWFMLLVLAKLQQHMNPSMTLTMFFFNAMFTGRFAYFSYTFLKLVPRLYSIND